MKVFGTMYDDEFLLRASSSITGLAFVALINEDPNVERVNYWKLERIRISGSFGDDYFAVDDTHAEVTIEGNEGEDRFQVGQLYRSPRDGGAYEFNHIETEDIYFTIETTVGWLSNGISKPMTIYGGTENDYFTVFHNKEVLSLFGEDGDDTFLIKAFALAGSQEPQRERTDVSGGAGADLVQYAMNAPVNIDGGDGFDTVIIIGTEFGDDFVITKDGVYGAGLNVNFVNIESLSVDGAEGDDRFYVMSTSEKFATQIFGGLGSDTFNISGDTPPVISNDLRGHSGIITHDIENTGTIYDETIIAGISANVADNDKQDPTVVISEPDGSTVIIEGGLWDYYQIVLSKSPGSGNEVIVQVMAPVQTQDQEERGSKLLKLWSSNETASTPDRTTISLTFDDTNWYTPQYVWVGATYDVNPDLDYDDNAMEGPATGFINHVVTSDIGIPGPLHPEIVNPYTLPDDSKVTQFYDAQVNFEDKGVSSGYMVYINDGPGAGQSLRVKEVQGHELLLYGHFRSDYMPDGTSTYTIRQDISAVRAVTALVYDNDKAGVVISETDASTEIFEGGVSDTINVVLTRQPTADVEVTLLSNDDQLSFSESVLTFSNNPTAPNAWNKPQTVTVTALDDSVREGFHHGLISFTVASSDSDTDVNVTGESTTLTMTQAYVGLKNRPKNGQVTEVRVGGIARDPSLYEVISNKVIFIKEAGTNEYEFLPAGTVVDVDYTYVNLGYDNLEVKPVLTDIADNDVAQVKITETGSSTDVIEDAQYTGTATSGGTDSLTDTGASFPGLSDYLVQITGGTGTGQVRTIASNTSDTITVTSTWDIAPDNTSEYAVILPDHDYVPFTDTYEVVLTKVPDASVQILITPDITKTSAGPTIHWNKQVAVTSIHPDAVDNGDGTLTLTFTTSNWDIPQTVKVIAVDDDYYDGDDTQVFAPQLHTVSDIQGPLYLYGAGGYGSIIAFEPLMLHYELNDMKETDTVIDVGDDGTTITVGADKLLAGAAAINSNVTDVEDLVTEKMTVTIADGVDEIGQFRLIVGAVLDDKGTGYTTDDEVTLTLNAPWELSEGEEFDDITEYTITRMSPNFFAVEAEQIDYVFVYNEDSPADNIIESRQGLLTDSTMDGFTGNAIVEEFVTQMDGKWLSGFGMGTEDLKIGPYYHPHGITYGDMEVVEINLGDGIDHFTVEDTHIRADGFQTWTIINTGDEYIGTDGDLVTVSLNSDVKELHSGTVTSASEYTLYDSGAAFPVTLTEKGLAGYIVEITGGTGLGQRRVIASNTATDLTLSESGNINPDDMSNYRIMGAELATGDTTTYLADATDTLADTSGSFDSSLLGKVLEIIDGPGAGFKKEIIEVVDDHTLRLSSDWAFDDAPTEQSHYRIYGDQDGPVSINTQAGEDTVVGSASSIPLVIFGGEGEDTIFGGSADDIIFGDNGIVAYVNEEYVSEEYEGEDGKIVTLLGLARYKIDPEYVTAATESTLTDDDPVSFPVQSIDKLGLEGLMVSITDGAGFRQDPRLITLNTSDTLTVYPAWETALNPDPGGIFDPTNPDSNPSKYRISFVPEDQTDAVVRDPSLLIAIDETVGGDDTITGNGGSDRIFGGLGDDEIHGNTGDDIIFGDHGRLDYTPDDTVGGEDGPAQGDFVPATLDRVRTTFDDIGGADTIYGDDGDDIILGGYNESGPGAPATTDYLYGNTSNDIIIGDNGLLDFSPNASTTDDPRDVVLYSIETIAPDDGGDDIIYGNEANDIIFGGDEDDTIDAGEGNNIVFGDNGLIDYVRAETDPGVPGADLDQGDIDLIESNATTFAGGIDNITSGDGQDIIIGGRFGDTVNAGNGDNLVIGDSGRITAADADDPQFAGMPMTFGLIETIEPDDGGKDNVTTGSGFDIVLGGDEGDTVDVGEGNNIVLGDNGRIDYVREERDGDVPGADLNPDDIDLIETTPTTYAASLPVTARTS